MKGKKQHIPEGKEASPAKRWVLLERIPTILTPRVLFLFFIYSVAFTLFLIGLKLFFLEQKAASQSRARKAVHTESSDGYGVVYAQEGHRQMQEDIAKNIIRLHVIANSDSDADQQLKLAVRDEVLASLQTSLANVSSVSQAKEIIVGQQAEIRTAAEKVLASQNNSASVSVSLQPRYFPVKQYGDFTFPAGIYQALCVEIGKAEGRNWWCVLFPSLCFVDETSATVPDEAKERLKEQLSPEEYEAILNENSKPELRLGLLDWLTGH